jgi:hypothetical protein
MRFLLREPAIRFSTENASSELPLHRVSPKFWDACQAATCFIREVVPDRDPDLGL